MEKVKVPSSLEVWEEAANAATHGLGLVLSLCGFAWLIEASWEKADLWRAISCLLFGTTLTALYATSTCYHTVQRTESKRLWRKADHCAIYALIAGSYTPFTLITLSDSWGWYLFFAVWSCALLGICYKITIGPKEDDYLSTFFYIGMGWLVLLAFEPLTERLHPDGLKLLVAGGLFYTLGAIIYALQKPRFHHAIWHLFVLGGSMCHYFSIFCYVLP